VPYKLKSAASRIEGIDRVDDHTVVIRWKSFFLGAGRLISDDLFLLPRHLLEETFPTIARHSLTPRPGTARSSV